MVAIDAGDANNPAMIIATNQFAARERVQVDRQPETL